VTADTAGRFDVVEASRRIHLHVMDLPGCRPDLHLVHDVAVFVLEGGPERRPRTCGLTRIDLRE
jgi:hypothetical protein